MKNSSSKNMFHRKNKSFRENHVLCFLSYLMYYLSKWHRGTPTVPPVGAVNVPVENPEIEKIHVFEDFWGHFFLINHIGFSLKYVIPKSSTDFFHRKQKVFREKNTVFVLLCLVDLIDSFLDCLKQSQIACVDYQP